MLDPRRHVVHFTAGASKGVEHFAVRLVSGAHLQVIVPVFVTVTNTPPLIGCPTLVSRDGAPVYLERCASDENGDPLTLSAANPSRGAISREGGSLLFTPEEGFVGVARLDLTADDGDDTSSAPIAVTALRSPQRASLLINGSRSRTGLVGDAVIFTATGFNAGGRSEMHWSFGDGAVRPGGLEARHVYKKAGSYRVTVSGLNRASDTVAVRIERPDLQIVWVRWKRDRLSVHVRTQIGGTIRARLVGYRGTKTFKDAAAKSRTITFKPAKPPRLGQVRVEVRLSPTGRQSANVTKVTRLVSVPLSATRR